MNSDNSLFRAGWAAPLTVFFFLICLFGNSYQSDLNYWTRWMTELGSGGYARVNANYPPLLLHWFWLLAQVFKGFGFSYPPESTIILKYVVLFPVLLIQVWLSMKVEKDLIKTGKDPISNPVFWAVVCSPPMLLDAALWGQVDILPFIPMWASLLYAVRGKLFLSGVVFAVALMCKFQAIVLLPLLGGLWLRFWIRIPKLILGFGLAGFVGFLPFILVGRFLDALGSAYWGNLNIYPFSTYNAANLWYVWTGNSSDVHLSVFRVSDGVLSLITPHKIGLGLFIGVSLLVMYRGMAKIKEFHQTIPLAVVLILTFFAFAPSMHERYLFLLVPFTALAYAKGYLSGGWFAMASVVVGLNINLILNIRAPEIWTSLSWAIVGMACVAFWIYVLGFRLRLPSLGPVGQFGLPVAILMLLGFTGFQGNNLYKTNNLSFDKEGRIYLSEMNEISNYQAYGSLGRDRNTEKGILRIFDTDFSRGLGVHAKSELKYKIPSGAIYYHASYGLDHNGKNGSVEFKVLLDGEEVWASGRVTHEPAKDIWINIGKAEQLTLIVDPLGSNNSDHANWVNASFWKYKP